MILKASLKLFIFFLFLSFSSMLSVAVADKKTRKADAVLKETEMNIYTSPELFRFFLLHPGLNAKLAEGLGLSGVSVSKDRNKYVFTGYLFKIYLEKSEIRNKKHHLTFSYEMGIDDPLPLLATGTGVATISFTRERKESLQVDVLVSITAGNGMLDEITKNIPKILEVVFSFKMEKSLRNAEKLADYFQGGAGEILELVTDEDSEFTRSELNSLKKFFKKMKRS